MNKSLFKDLLVISVWSFSVFFVGFFIERDIFINRAFPTGLISAVPSIVYMFVRKKKNWKKILLGTIVFGGLFGHFLEFLANKSLLWQCKSLVFNGLIFNTSTYDCTFGYVLMTIFMLTFYEHFLDRDIQHFIPKKILLITLPFAVIGASFYFVDRYGLAVPLTSRPYLFLGCLAIVPLIYLIFKNPKIITKLLFISVYFFVYYFVFELLAVYKGFWIYPSESYIGWVSVFQIKFPFEELFFWMMLYAGAIVSYYELFLDDGK